MDSVADLGVLVEDLVLAQAAHNVIWKRQDGTPLVFRSASGAPVDLTGYGARATFKDKAGGTLAWAQLTAAGGGVLLGGTSGTVALVLTQSLVFDPTITSGVFDVMLDPGGAPSDTSARFMQGKWSLSQSVSDGGGPSPPPPAGVSLQALLPLSINGDNAPHSLTAPLVLASASATSSFVYKPAGASIGNTYATAPALGAAMRAQPGAKRLSVDASLNGGLASLAGSGGLSLEGDVDIVAPADQGVALSCANPTDLDGVRSVSGVATLAYSGATPCIDVASGARSLDLDGVAVSTTGGAPLIRASGTGSVQVRLRGNAQLASGTCLSTSGNAARMTITALDVSSVSANTCAATNATTIAATQVGAASVATAQSGIAGGLLAVTVLGGGGTTPWGSTVTAPQTLAQTRTATSTAGGAFAVTMPASPKDTDEYVVKDDDGSWAPGKEQGFTPSSVTTIMEDPLNPGTYGAAGATVKSNRAGDCITWAYKAQGDKWFIRARAQLPPPPPSWDPSQGFDGGSVVLRVRGDGLFDDGTGKASSWADTSGALLYKPAQTTPAARPSIVTGINGRKAARFSGAQGIDCGTALVPGNQLTVFVVFATSTVPSFLNSLVSRCGAANSWAIWGPTGITKGFGMMVNDAGTETPSTTRYIADGTIRQLIGSWDGTLATPVKTLRSGGRIVATKNVGSTGPIPQNAADHVQIGCYGNLAGCVTADIYEVIILAGIPTAKDIARLNAYTEYYYSCPEWTHQAIFLGDSITAGTVLPDGGGWPPAPQDAWPAVMMKNLGRSWGDPQQDTYPGISSGNHDRLCFNAAYPGHMLLEVANTDAPLFGGFGFDPEFKKNVCFVAAGTNDIFLEQFESLTLAQVISRAKSVCAAIRALPNGSLATIVWCSVISRVATLDQGNGSDPAFRISLWNAWTQWLQTPGNVQTLDVTGGPIVLCDLTADPRLGGQTAYLDTTIFIDETHPTALGESIIAGLATNTARQIA